ncbi:MAG: DUF4186 domain-containing protein [Sedimentisphaerales bacterium]|jgi:hypothetical protein
MGDFDKLFEKLSRSKFRNSFKLKPADIEYINERGMATIEQHARDFITKRLAPAEPKNDGRQTPTQGHPVFIAQHATGTCCRKCLQKWHNISQNKPLSGSDVNYIVLVLIAWIKKQVDICGSGI